jgi:tRNA/tmRNA/rRNA uracil-C5-methylase (TrmA/RlmC/RlmD family)
MASFIAPRLPRIDEQALEEINTANFEHIVEISCERTTTKEACRLLDHGDRAIEAV